MPHKPYSPRIRELAEKWTKGTISEAEKQEFIDWYNQFDDQEIILPGDGFNNPDALKKEIYQAVQQRIQDERGKRFSLRWVTAAAAILLALVTGGYFLFFNKLHKTGELASTTPVSDIKAPAINRAMITLADSSIVYLDSVANGQLAMQDHMKLVKLANGQIAYQSTDNDQPATISYNTLTNPRGSRAIDMTLADGSRVWLNAGSSVTYPVEFTGNERKVSITGEAYFEVTHFTHRESPSQNPAAPGAEGGNIPFIVEKGSMQVTVLGTKFNVKAYDDEQDIRITLLEGSVRASAGPSREGVMLKPGQQAHIADDVKVKSNIDLEQVMAWKNGLFKFNDEELTTIMKQIERWYNVEVEYRGNVKPLNFGGIVSRKENVSAVLDLLQLTGVVAFSIEPSAKASAKIVVTIKP